MKSEDDIHCSRRLKALVAVVLLMLGGVRQGVGDCLNVTLQTRGNISGLSRAQIISLFEAAGQRIEYLTGLDTGIFVRVVIYQDPHEYLRQGGPAWSAAAYRDGVIHLRNPLVFSRYRTLQQVISHELLHAIIDHHGYSLPVWFEEGLAQVLASGSNDPVPHTGPVDQTTQDFYRTAYQRVTDLIDQYGWEGIQTVFRRMPQDSFSSAYHRAFPLEPPLPGLTRPAADTSESMK